jgi:nucleotide-binding universal stress UspA family protein
MYKRILVPTDGSDTAEAGLHEACKLAQAQADSRIRVIHVVDELLTVLPELYGVAYDAITDAVRKSGASLLAHNETVAREYGLTVETQLIEAMGSVAGDLVIRAAKEWPADLIVCGTHGRRGLRRIVMGSDAEYIVRHTPVPILLIRKDGR